MREFRRDAANVMTIFLIVAWKDAKPVDQIGWTNLYTLHAWGVGTRGVKAKLWNVAMEWLWKCNCLNTTLQSHSSRII